MATPKIINKFGTLTGWNNVTTNILGREIEGIDEIMYKDEQDVVPAYGGGKYPIGSEEKNYKATASVNLYFEEVAALQKQLPKGSRIQDIPPFDIIVSYDIDAVPYKDILRSCRFTSNPRELKQGEGKIVQKMDLFVPYIDWNV